MIAYILSILNLLSFGVFAYDKYKAKRKAWRIPEKKLTLAMLIAPFGAYISMQFFRHKTQVNWFKFSCPILMLIQLIGGFYLWKFINP